MTARRRFLFALWDGGGNVPPTLGIVARLIARGHAVAVLSDPTLDADVTAAGAELLPWTTAPHRHSRRREHDVVKDYDHKSPLASLRAYVRDFIARPAARWTADTHAALQAFGADMLVGARVALTARAAPAEAGI